MTLTAKDLQVGQKVVLSNSRRGKPSPGTVTKVGRTLVTIQNDALSWHHAQYRIATGGINDNYGGWRFWTEQEWARRQQVDADWKTLQQAGLDARMGQAQSFDPELLHEIAELIRSRAS